MKRFFDALEQGKPPRMTELRTGTAIRRLLLDRIRGEAHPGGHMIFKFNHVTDPQILAALRSAAKAGARVDLLARTTLTEIAPGVHAKSLVGRFLEHARVAAFRNGGRWLVFAGSLDAMPRNFDRRYEIFFPVKDPPARRMVLSELRSQVADDVNSFDLLDDGSEDGALGREPGRAAPRRPPEAPAGVRGRDLQRSDRPATTVTPRRDRRWSGWRGYAGAVALVVGTTAVGAATRAVLDVPDVEMLYVVAVLVSAVFLGRGPAIASAAVGVLAYDYFFVPPTFTLNVADLRYLFTFAMMFGIGLLVSSLADRARDAAVRAESEALRGTLLSSVSHDLRTPLAAITGAATTLRDQAVDEPTRRELVEAICDEAERMERLVGNLLDMTRLASGAVAARREWIPVDELVGAALSRTEALLSRHRVRTEIPAAPVLVSVDPRPGGATPGEPARERRAPHAARDRGPGPGRGRTRRGSTSRSPTAGRESRPARRSACSSASTGAGGPPARGRGSGSPSPGPSPRSTAGPCASPPGPGAGPPSGSPSRAPAPPRRSRPRPDAESRRNAGKGQLRERRRRTSCWWWRTSPRCAGSCAPRWAPRDTACGRPGRSPTACARPPPSTPTRSSSTWGCPTATGSTWSAASASGRRSR